MNSQPPPDDSAARDAHLIAALRHAPDRDVAPPAQLTAAILGQARQALRPGWRERWRAAFAGLWQPVPMAAFGTLAMATLIGVLWGNRELPEAAPSLRPSSEPAVRPGAEPAVRQDSEPAIRPGAAADVQSGAAAPTAAESAAASAAAVAAPQTAARQVAKGAAVRPPAHPRAPKPADPPATAAAPAEPSLAEARQDGAQGRRRNLGNASTSATPSAATPPSPPPAAPEPAGIAAAPVPAPREALAKSSADADAPARARSEAAPSLGVIAPTAATPLAAPGAEIDAAVGTDASRVHWQLAPLRVVGHGAAQRAWWSALMSATRGRWQRVQDSAASGEPPALTLLIDGTPRGSLVIESEAVVWRDASSGAAWRAPLSAQQLLAWREAFERW